LPLPHFTAANGLANSALLREVASRGVQGGARPDALGKKIFEESCVSCHNWTGVSRGSPC